MAEFKGGTLYEANKNLVKQYEKHITGPALTKKIETVIKPYISEKIKTDNYFMLLCNDKKDYTVFHRIHSNNDTVIDNFCHWFITCLTNRGSIYAIDQTQDGMALEIWIKYKHDHIKDDFVCYYLFPYTSAVIDI